MRVTVEQIDREREEELIVRRHDPGAAWVEGVQKAASEQRTIVHLVIELSLAGNESFIIT